MQCEKAITRTARLRHTAIVLALCLVLPSFCAASGHTAVIRDAVKADAADQHESASCHDSQPHSSLQAPVDCPDCCASTQQQQAAITSDKFVQTAATTVTAVIVVPPVLSSALQIVSLAAVTSSPPTGHFTLRI